MTDKAAEVFDVLTKSADELIAHRLMAIFHGNNDCKFEVRHLMHKGHQAVVVTCGAMYERPEYVGGGGVIGMLTAIQTICGGNMIEECGKINRTGCDTCDYGSFYADEFMVWTE